MARVCCVRGKVVVEDTYASEHRERAAYQDRWEILRDPSHLHTLSLSELLHLFRNAYLEADFVSTSHALTLQVERWLATTKTLPERAWQIRKLLEDDHGHDLSGARPFQDATGELFFRAWPPSWPDDGAGSRVACSRGQPVQNKAHTVVLGLLDYCVPSRFARTMCLILRAGVSLGKKAGLAVCA